MTMTLFQKSIIGFLNECFLICAMVTLKYSLINYYKLYRAFSLYTFPYIYIYSFS